MSTVEIQVSDTPRGVLKVKELEEQLTGQLSIKPLLLKAVLFYTF